MTVGTAAVKLSDADLPTLDYSADENPAQVYPRLREAQEQAPIAIGPFGPEALSYPMVRAVLRDKRFQVPQGIVLQAQGVTSGPLWDKVVTSILCLEGEEHQRLRGLCSRGSRRERWRAYTTPWSACWTTSSMGSPAAATATSWRTSRALTPSRSSPRCSARRVRTGSDSRCGPT